TALLFPYTTLFRSDHMPGLDWSFYTRITPSDSEFERTLKAYTVPFYIWANYDLDLEEESLEFTSANYLGMHLLKLIGVPLTPWYQYLEQMEEQKIGRASCRERG